MRKESPKNPRQKIIKRVIGLEGDFIRKWQDIRPPDMRLEDHEISFVLVQIPAVKQIPDQQDVTTLGYKNRFVRVPDGHFWLEGDHHGHSLDSNSFGPVSVGLLHGRASHIIWPPNRWQRIAASLPPNRGPLDAEEEEG
ncbi:hypothetical protein JOQ06_004083 [Pogonophryne albipinna]|uniref:Mitochondrial inner membrane protease subunit n=1 Tax=Pogonophryne albipinna TaxID=1090488 RepID=A0AAD6AFC9_9TELE|nr:hypothetical protein JOQ06_004083 [Pogonophryne albipinna]